MNATGRTFRIFVSSTFSDLKEERNALQEQVFPRLRKLCEDHGCRFQAIDLRWGVSEETALDQQAMNICFAELERCQRITPRPNFIILLGDRYGWLPLPPQIDALEFEEILTQVSEADKTLLVWNENKPDGGGWYRKDDNAVPAEYCLQPRKLKIPDNASAQERVTAQENESREWQDTERRLREILLTAITVLGWPKEDSRRNKYEYSATHQEIQKGALNLPEGREHVFAFLREISNVKDLAGALPKNEKARDFLDTTCIDNAIQFDETAHSRIVNLKKELSCLSGVTTFPYQAQWTGDGLDAGYLDKLCDDAYQSLSRVMLEQIKQIEEIEPLTQEIIAHQDFAQDRAQHFLGREDILGTIDKYVHGASSPSVPDPKHPLFIYGPSGSGKSALMGKAFLSLSQSAIDNLQSITLCRFIGATPASTDLRSLLDGLCREIYDKFGFEELKQKAEAETRDAGKDASSRSKEDPFAIPSETAKLIETFRRFLKMIPENQQVILVLDALDQLNPIGNTHSLYWLPQELPGNVRIVVSVLDRKDKTEGCLQVARRRLSENNLLSLEPLTPQQGATLLDVWLKEAGRTKEIGRALQPEQRNDILAKFAVCPMPLYLKVASVEASRWKSYDGLPCGADEEPGLSPSIEGVINDLLWRLELPTNHGATLTSKAFAYLCAARNGLSENEILDVLSADKEVMDDFRDRSPRSPDVKQLPVIVWLRLFADLEPYLAERNADNTALLGFYHRQLGEVVSEKYLTEQARLETHAALAQYFGALLLWTGEGKERVPNYRKCSELPYQQMKAEMWDEAEKTLTDLFFIEAKVCAPGLGIDAVLADTALAAAASQVNTETTEEYTSRHLCFQTLQEQLWAEASALRREPQLVVQQMANRFLWLPEGNALLRQQGQTAVARALSEGRDLLTALLPPWFAAGETQDAQTLGQKVDAAVLMEQSLVLWSHDGHWQVVDDSGNHLMEGSELSIPVQQVVADHVALVVVSGQKFRFWYSWPTGSSFLYPSPWPIQQVSLANMGKTVLVVGERGEWCRYTVHREHLIEEGFGNIGLPTSCCALSQSGCFWIIGTMDGQLLRCTLAGRERFGLHQNMVRAVAISPNGNLIASGAQDGIIQVRTFDGKIIQEINCGGWVNCLTFSSAGDQVLAATEAGQVIGIPVDSSANPLIWLTVPTHLIWMGVFPQNNVAAVLGADHHIRLIRSPAPFASSVKLPLSGRVVFAASVTAGQEILVADSTGERCLIDVGEGAPGVTRISHETGSVVAATLAGSDDIFTVYNELVSPRVTQQQLTDKSASEHVVWPRSTGWGRPDSTLVVQDAACSPDDRLLLLVTQCFKGSLSIELTTILEVYEIHPWKRVFAVPIKPNGGQAAIANDGALVVYGLRSVKQPILICRSARNVDFVELPMNGFLGAAFSGAGDGLLIIDGQGQSWFSSEPRRAEQYQLIGSRVTSGTISPNGRLILLTHDDGRICLLSVPNRPLDVFAPLAQTVISWIPSYCRIEPHLSRILVGGVRTIQVFRWDLATMGISSNSKGVFHL